MTFATLVRGWRRDLDAQAAPVYEIQVRRALRSGQVVVQRRIVHTDLAAATAQFDVLRRLGGLAYTSEHGYRLVLIQTGGRSWAF